MRRCLDWRLGAGLAAIAVAIWVLAPQWAAAVLPLLIVAACPLMMLVMMPMMMRGRGSSPVPATGAEAQAGGRAAQLRRQLADLRAQEEAVLGELTELAARDDVEETPGSSDAGDEANTQMAPPDDRAATAHPSGPPRSG